MKKLALNGLKLFVALLFLTPSLIFADTALASNNKTSGNTQLLFVMLANKGEIKAIGKKKNDYQLILKNVNPYVIYFTNIPKRYTSKISIPEFVQQWQTGSFKKEPPNAMIEAVRLHHSFFKEHKKSLSYAVVLTHPVYNKAKDELRFTIQELKGSTSKLPDFSHADYVAVFIDNATVCPDCIGI